MLESEVDVYFAACDNPFHVPCISYNVLNLQQSHSLSYAILKLPYLVCRAKFVIKAD